MRELAFSCTFNWVMGLVKSARQSGLRFCDMSGLLAEDMQPRKLWYVAAGFHDFVIAVFLVRGAA